jgi:kumamolisin
MRNAQLVRATAFIVASSLLAACGGAGAGSALPGTSPTSTQNPGTTTPGSSQSFTWGANLTKSATLVRPASFKTMTVDVLVKPQNAQGLITYAKQVSDPHSPLYRHFLTPQQIGSQFGASQNDVAAAAAYFQNYHLGVGTWPQHLLMVVAGTQTNLEAAFGTKFGVFRTPAGHEFVAPESAPRFSGAVPVTAVARLAHVVNEHTDVMLPGSGETFSGMHPSQYARGFDFTGAYNAGYNGSGINIGIIGTGGISPADVPAFGQMTGSPVAKVTEVPVVAQAATPQNGNTGSGAFGSNPTGFATPPPVTDPNCSGGSAVYPTATCNPEDGEAQLDTEQSASLAPGANVLFYLALNTMDCGGACSQYGILGVQGLYESDDEIQQAIADNTADVISMSYGLGEPEGVGYYYDGTGAGIGPLEFAALTSEGIAAFASSGDNGAYECATQNSSGQVVFVNSLCTSYPASDPSVVAVGGVNTPFDAAGNLVPGQQITAWADNTTGGGYGVFVYNAVGSGGGPSAVFPAPKWQGTIAAAGGMRATPDIALAADPLTGPLLLMNSAFPDATGYGASGGTSAAAPQMAAAWAVVLSACKANPACVAKGSGPRPWRMANPNPLLYSIYQGNTTYAAPSAFYDVTAGSNGAITTPGGAVQPGFNAGTGYDMVTGIGVPFIGHLIDATFSAQGLSNPNLP